ncbi:MAG: hypothetical protein OIF49_03195 [Thiotrichaceae bacterium]|nr:hypothetical protein [Thiotrichaceae bacterium]
MPFVPIICIVTIAKQWIRNDFVFSFDFVLPHILLVLSCIQLIYLGHIFIRERLFLDHTGIRYQSGKLFKLLWNATSNNDWHFHWENIQTISVVQTNSSYYAQLRFIVRQCEKQDYETPIFKWVDSHTLDTAHTKSIYKYKVFGFEFTGRDTITAEEFNESVLRTPIYQYLAQYQEQSIRIIPEKAQHIIEVNTHSHKVLSLYFLLIALFVIAIVFIILNNP